VALPSRGHWGMNMETNKPAQIGGDWDLRGVSLDSIFAANELSDTAIDAVIRTSARFDSSFPGWLLYRRVASGSNLFDRQLEAWAIGCARALSRAEQVNGRSYVSGATRRKPGWVAQAGRDALDYAIFGKFPATVDEREARFGVSHKTYRKLRDPVARCMWVGMDTFRAMLFLEYWHVRRDEKNADAAVRR